MATPEQNHELAVETAEAILTTMKAQAGRWTNPSDLKALAEGYATLVDAMAKPRPKGSRVTTS